MSYLDLNSNKKTGKCVQDLLAADNDIDAALFFLSSLFLFSFSYDILDTLLI